MPFQAAFCRCAQRRCGFSGCPLGSLFCFWRIAWVAKPTSAGGCAALLGLDPSRNTARRCAVRTLQPDGNGANGSGYAPRTENGAALSPLSHSKPEKGSLNTPNCLQTVLPLPSKRGRAGVGANVCAAQTSVSVETPPPQPPRAWAQGREQRAPRDGRFQAALLWVAV